MSKFLIMLVFVFTSSFTFARAWHEYEQCRIFIQKAGSTQEEKDLTNLDQIRGKFPEAAKSIDKCQTQMQSLESFVKSDGQVVVDEESLATELQGMVQDHIGMIADDSQLYSEFRGICSGLISEYETGTVDEISGIRVDQFNKAVDVNTPSIGLGFGRSSLILSSFEVAKYQGIESPKQNLFMGAKGVGLAGTPLINIDKQEQQPTEYIIPRKYKGIFETLDKIVPVCMDQNEKVINKYIDGGVKLDRSGNLTFVDPSKEYLGRLCEYTVQAKCFDESATTVEDCQAKINSYSTFSEAFGGNEKLGILGEQSVKMVGHCYEKKKLEKYVAVTKNQGNFDESEGYFEGETGTKCRRSNRYTVDYKACVGIVGAQNAVVVGQIASQSVGAVTDSLHKSSIQRGYNEDIKDNKSPQEAALEAQKRTYMGQRNIATGASSTYGASAAGLSGMLAAYPSQGSFSRKCKRLDLSEKRGADKGINYCYLIQRVKQDESLRGMFANQKIKDGAWGTVGQLGAESLKHALEAAHFNDMYKQTGGMQNDLNNALEEVATIGFDSCQANPELCDQSGTPGETSTFEMGNFNMGNNGSTDLAYTKPPESIGDTDSGASVSKTVANKLSDSLSETGENFSSDFKKIGAGSLKNASSGGASGGGSAPGGGGGSVAGGSDGPSGSADSGSSSSFAGVKAKWNGGGGSVGYRKGGGTAKKKANPYGSLFDNKKGSRNIASEVNDIAAKESGLFKKISNRYEKLNSANRLKKF